LRIEGISKRYAAGRDDHLALADVSFAVPTGAFVTLLGSSGCGKSTLLNLIAGLDRPTSGRIEIGGKLVCDSGARLFTPAAERNVSMVFQSYAVWPHMTVRENVEFPLRYGRKKGQPAAEREAAVAHAVDKVRLTALQHRPAPLLSGGQQQRVSLARALAQKPALILLDEPLSNLDASLREEMQKEIRAIVSDEGITAIYVTHDQKEALMMSDVIAVMNEGRIAQIGSPRDIYFRPESGFVAQFMGSPNLLRAHVTGLDGERNLVVAECALGTVRLRGRAGVAVAVGERLMLVLKQEDLRTGEPAAADCNVYTLPVLRETFLGDRLEVTCPIQTESGKPLTIYTRARQAASQQQVTFSCPPDEVHYFRL
jgi:iron(III) transport system ATP-binding protein